MKQPNVLRQISGIIVITREKTRGKTLMRVISHMVKRWKAQVSSFFAAERIIEQEKPDAVVIDISDFSSGEYIRQVEPFLSRLPRNIKTFFVDTRPTARRVVRASKQEVDGILKAPLSHHGVTTLLEEFRKEKTGSDSHTMRPLPNQRK